MSKSWKSPDHRYIQIHSYLGQQMTSAALITESSFDSKLLGVSSANSSKSKNPKNLDENTL